MSGPLVVIDTGVVITGMIGDPSASSARVVRAAGTGAVRAALSDALLRELSEIVLRKEQEGLVRSPSRAFDAAVDLWTHGTLYRPTRIDWPSVNDPEDHWILDLAWESEADYIVARDPHLTRATMPFDVEVLLPHELLASLPAPR